MGIKEDEIMNENKNTPDFSEDLPDAEFVNIGENAKTDITADAVSESEAVKDTEATENTAEEVTENIDSTEDVSEADTADSTEKTVKIRSAYRLKYGSFAAAVTALFIAAVILFNVIFSVLADKYPLAVDMTATNAYTVDPENVDFIKGINYPVKLRVLFTEDQYKEGSYAAYYRNITDTSDGKYYAQTVELLKQYKKYNNNISVDFVDPYDNSISTVIQDYIAEDISIDYGDILVEAYPDGKDSSPRRGAIAFNDCYQLETAEGSEYSYETGSESFTLTGNKVEQAVANGIFKTVNLETVKAGVLTVGSSDAYLSNFQTVAKENAIEITPISVIDKDEMSKYNILFVCAPSVDYTADEVKTLSDWLENDGKKGRSLYFFASAASPKLQNLYGLLEEWGIEVRNGYKLYSDNDRYYSGDHTNIYLDSAYSDYTKSIDSLGYNYIADNMLPLRKIYDSEPGGKRTVTEILTTADTATYEKADSDSKKPSGAGTIGTAMLLSKNADEGESSYIVACSSVDFLTNAATVTKTDNGNYKFLISLINSTSRDSTDKYVMQTKVLGDVSANFTTSTNNFQTIIIGVVFIGLIPISLIAAAIIIYIKRKNY